MDRREVLKVTTLFLGYTITAGTAGALLNGCKADSATDWSPKTLSSQESELLAEICESILPKTDTPGAKDAMCHRYIDEMLTNFYDKNAQIYFKESLIIFDNKSRSKYSKAFIALNSNEKEEILNLIVKDSKVYKGDSGKKPHIFKMIKDATISGYFSSEIGANGGLCAFLPIPGPYQGCIEFSSVGKNYVII